MEALAQTLAKEEAGLHPDINEDDNKTAEAIHKIADELAKLLKDVTDYLR